MSAREGCARGVKPRSLARSRVGLFVTCLVDLMRPSVGFAAVKLLEDAGCKVVVPVADLLRPARLQFRRSRHGAGDRAPDDRGLRELRLCRRAERLLRRHARQALSRAVRRRARHGGKASAFAAKCHELSSFLVDRLGVTKVSARYDGVVAYHDSCSGLRELGVASQPRKLLASVEGLRLVELKDADVCCGFGGDVRGQVRRIVRRDRRPRRAPTSPRAAPTRCSPAISAA